MKARIPTVSELLAVALLTIPSLGQSASKSYSSGGGHSYSSSSSHSSSSGGSHSFSSGSHSFSPGGTSTHSSGGIPAHSSSYSGDSHGSKSGGRSGAQVFSSGGGKSYSSGRTWSDESRHSYTAGKSYTSGSDHTFTSSSSSEKAPPPHNSDSRSAQLSFDSAAARAKNQEDSKADFSKFKKSQVPPAAASSSSSTSYQRKPPPFATPTGGYSRPPAYIPDPATLSTRPVRIYNVYNSYSSRPIMTYHDPYNSFFWWWLLDRSLDDRAIWAYHHRYNMDPARYQALVANDQQLETRIAQLETQQVSRDPGFVPAGLDHDLMYSDRYVTHLYHNRPTTSGAIAFWVLAVPTALGVCAFFIWLIWFKRWQTAT